MQRYEIEVASEPVVINRVETEGDLDSFRDFIRAHQDSLGCDSETTGLNIYQSDFRVRLVQFGTKHEAYVVPVEHGGRFVKDACRALRGVKQLIFQNASFDLQVFEQRLGIRMEGMWPRVLDTKILAHLVDSRAAHEGGTGHSLEDLVRHYLDAAKADEIKGLMAKLAAEHKTTKAQIWKLVDLDNPEYNIYAGADPVFAARLAEILQPKVPATARKLIQFEHELAEPCSYMERTGYLLDVKYTEALSDEFLDAEAEAALKAAQYGVRNVNSTEQVADGLEAQYLQIPETTKTGKRKVDKKLLDKLASEGNALALAVHDAKKARKWRTTWVKRFLDSRDDNDRCHASIQPLRARTARMSITGIPAQTLPSSDWMIRRCFVSDIGHVSGGTDYANMELRVLAALSGDRRMQRAFREGDDLHQITADAANVPRKAGKTTNFCVCFGGGWKAVSEQAGVEPALAKKAVKGFWETYPEVAKLARKLQAEAARRGFIMTPTGRRLYVDEDRGYSALNYLIQSTARDITAQAILKLHAAGMTPYMRLPIHDEIVFSFPVEQAEFLSQESARLMRQHLKGVDIPTDPEITGKSWGHGYMKGKNGEIEPELQRKADEEIKAVGLW